MSKIEWTERTWNPIVGCSKVSEGCRNCYAIRMAWRLSHNPKTADRYAGTVHKTCGGKTNWTGVMNVLSDVALLPLQVKKPTIWFVNSMSDLFHESLDDATIVSLFDIMRDCPQHTFQVVTKRTARAAEFLRKYSPEPLPNVWLIASVENQQAAEERIPHLLAAPAAVRGLSCEPLLGPVELNSFLFMPDMHGSPADIVPSLKLDWVIVGGESGPDARPMHPEWARSLRDECTLAGVPFFFKQWGEWYTTHFKMSNPPTPTFVMWRDYRHFTQKFWSAKGDACVDMKGKLCKSGGDMMHAAYPVAIMQRLGKKAAGRLLDGHEWNEMPKGNFSPVKNVGDE